jgi:hypothetical protein
MDHEDLPADLVTRVNNAEVAFFVGAGCSIEEPAKLPRAQQLADALVEKGLGESGDTLEDVAEECQRRGKNVLSEALPKAEWRSKPCNWAHRVLSQLAKEGLTSEVITTNWDTLIEHGLRNGGVPYTPVVSPQLLREGGVAGGVRVAKIHGCIDHPEEPLRATQADLEDWAQEWARALFDYLARVMTFVFVGYSGAAGSVTITLDAIAQGGGRPSTDYVIDPAGRESLAGSEHGEAFVNALGDDSDRFLPMTSGVFFESLRVAIFPLLLQRPWQVVSDQVDLLCQPTHVEAEAILESALLIRRRFEDMGPDAVQASLKTLLAGMAQSELDHPYIPLIPNAVPLALVWIALALLTWSGSAEYADDFLKATPAIGEDIAFLAIAAGSQRRDAVAIQGVGEFVRSHASVGERLITVVFGEIGPLPEEIRVNASVVRGDAPPTIVRSAGPRSTWIEGSRLLSLFTSDVEADTVATSMRELLRESADLI